MLHAILGGGPLGEAIREPSYNRMRSQNYCDVNLGWCAQFSTRVSDENSGHLMNTGYSIAPHCRRVSVFLLVKGVLPIL